MQSKGPSLISQAISSYDTSSASVKEQRLGVGNDTNIQSKLDSLKTVFHDSLLGAYSASTSGTSGKRRRRSISSSNPLTCANLYSMSSASSLSSLTASDLSTLSTSEFTNCQSLYSTFSWSSSQASALISVMNRNYSGGISTIPDSDLAYYSTFLIGLTPSQLQTLTITSTNTINALGLVTTWTNTQLTSLVTAIKSNGNSLSSVLSQMKNLACGIASSDWSTIPTTTVSSAQSTLVTIDNADCPAIPNMFSILRSTTLDSASLTDLGVISGGFNSTDLSANAISTDLISFTTLTYTSASAVNSMTSAFLNALTTTQIAELTNSPNYASFSDAIKTSLSSLSSGTTSLSTSTTSTGTSSTSGNDSGLMAIKRAWYSCQLLGIAALYFARFNL